MIMIGCFLERAVIKINVSKPHHNAAADIVVMAMNTLLPAIQAKLAGTAGVITLSRRPGDSPTSWCKPMKDVESGDETVHPVSCKGSGDETVHPVSCKGSGSSKRVQLRVLPSGTPYQSGSVL
ncbi:hypothetical protein CEUSTIGMA_g9322.t1 [Chlamydomonas eustigma]|uniref:Uncharacterized protein n=1 Tax=Chlamydomonas eustigma TaxID=1157962 RepID=A0A250XFN9_9CHLO|nr:hypothetical protein CEUSTIGMA_g9322.t1 [Chlamydomonas eustigma]|eukprot:GAX81894.1 hypothetical protein CEUSTIGMA_g9322.t1 [Chlamydomonas eustigma]